MAADNQIIASPSEQSMLSYSNSNNFLSDWNGIRAYGNIPLSTLNFKLPAGETEFWIHINAHIGWDHPVPGAIKIKEICIRYEPYYILLPDTR